MMQVEKIHTVLSPTTKQSIATMLVNFVTTIPDDEEVEITFGQTEEDGKSHIYLDAMRISRTPDIKRTVSLTTKSLDVHISTDKKTT